MKSRKRKSCLVDSNTSLIICLIIVVVILISGIGLYFKLNNDHYGGNRILRFFT